MIFDFKSESDFNKWFSINDGVMGGVSSGRLEPSGAHTALFKGNVSFENNGGFSSVRSEKINIDFSGTSALILRVKGDGKKYKFRIQSSIHPSDVLYECVFHPSSSDWEEVTLPYKEFNVVRRGMRLKNEPPLDASTIQSLGFLISSQQEGPFELMIDWIKVL
ncbi:hypothetical protein BVX98_06985 [bacterium F11]|nr:hypothetical protein BVX98_06985 [bacterium F11]